MAQSKKARDLEILNYKINEYSEKIENFIIFKINDKKRNTLETLRDKAIADRDEIMAGPDY